MNSYKVDTHVHTQETSPYANVNAAEVVRLYKLAGYDSLIITDHYFPYFFEALGDISWEEKIDIYLKGYRIALVEGKKAGLNILLGMELCFKGDPNDYLVYGLTEEMLYKYPEIHKHSLQTFKKFITPNEVIIFQAHPFRSGMVRANPSLLDGVEVFNGNPRHNSRNNLAKEFAAMNNLKMTSGSDFHQEEDLARGGIIVTERVQTVEQFVSLIKGESAIELI